MTLDMLPEDARRRIAEAREVARKAVLDWTEAELVKAEVAGDPTMPTDKYREASERATALKDAALKAPYRYRAVIESAFIVAGLDPNSVPREQLVARGRERAAATAPAPPTPRAAPAPPPRPATAEDRAAAQNAEALRAAALEKVKPEVEKELGVEVSLDGITGPAPGEKTSPFKTGLDELKRKKGGLPDYF